MEVVYLYTVRVKALKMKQLGRDMRSSPLLLLMIERNKVYSGRAKVLIISSLLDFM
jgi:hypothetical protein